MVFEAMGVHDANPDENYGVFGSTQAIVCEFRMILNDFGRSWGGWDASSAKMNGFQVEWMKYYLKTRRAR